jgi:hypothetical protein
MEEGKLWLTPLRKQYAKVKEEAHGAWGMEHRVRITSTE